MPLKNRYAKLLAATVMALSMAATLPAQALQPTSEGNIFGPSAAPSVLSAPVPHILSLPRHMLTPKRSNKSDFGVFNSVAISAGTLPTQASWDKITGEDFTALYASNCQLGNALCAKPVAKSFRTIAAKAAEMPRIEALRYINRAVNRAIAYRDDNVGWGRSDYWADPNEIATRGYGDCEDYAIAKMWMLRSLGYDQEQLQLVVLKDTRSGLYHAVLAVHVNGERYVLDNLANNVATDDIFASYVPIVSFQGDNGYIHGFSGQRSTVATANGASSVSPGDGQ